MSLRSACRNPQTHQGLAQTLAACAAELLLTLAACWRREQVLRASAPALLAELSLDSLQVLPRPTPLLALARSCQCGTHPFHAQVECPGHAQ